METRKLFCSDRYVTRGVNEVAPFELQLLLWGILVRAFSRVGGRKASAEDIESAGATIPSGSDLRQPLREFNHWSHRLGHRFWGVRNHAAAGRILRGETEWAD